MNWYLIDINYIMPAGIRQFSLHAPCRAFIKVYPGV